jgi:hypothetical protein
VTGMARHRGNRLVAFDEYVSCIAWFDYLVRLDLCWQEGDMVADSAFGHLSRERLVAAAHRGTDCPVPHAAWAGAKPRMEVIVDFTSALRTKNSA